MIRFFLYISLFSTSLMAQPDEGIEFKLNTLSGVITDSITSENLMDVNIDIFTGNKVLKHSLLSDDNGYFIKDNIGYLWKPKIRLKLHNFKTKVLRLDPKLLDNENNISINIEMIPLPTNDRVLDLERSTLSKRAEIFFIKGNVFYNRLNAIKAKQIIINSVEAIETKSKYLEMKINGIMYDISKCYVPQEGKYENLSYILKSLLDEPIFENSGYPIYLPENLLEPSVIFGSIIDKDKNSPITGVEIILTQSLIDNVSNSDHDSLEIISMSSFFNINDDNNKNIPIGKTQYDTYKRRVSDQNGQFAFTVDKPAIYQLKIKPHSHYHKVTFGTTNIIVKYGRGGWYQSDFYLEP